MYVRTYVCLKFSPILSKNYVIKRITCLNIFKNFVLTINEDYKLRPFQLVIPVFGPVQTEKDMRADGFHNYIIIIRILHTYNIASHITYKISFKPKTITISNNNTYQDAANYTNINKMTSIMSIK